MRAGVERAIILSGVGGSQLYALSCRNGSYMRRPTSRSFDFGSRCAFAFAQDDGMGTKR